MRLDQPILVVDDDNAIRALLRTVLRRRGFRVDTATNGAEALEKLGATRYALVILDMMMPFVNGGEVLQWIAREEAEARPLVIVLSAGADLRAFESDFVIGTMHKPFDLDLLVDAVSGCLEESAGAVATAAPLSIAAETSQPN